jgi:hypothetical protein
MARRHRAATARQVRVLKAKATAAVMAVAKAAAKVAVGVKSNVATRALTTVVMARVAQRPATTALVPKGVAPIKHVAVRVAAKTTVTVMATNCHATSIP